jgi:uncharacterized protein (TIGR02611 family)
MLQVTYRILRRIVVVIIGFTVLVLGAVMLITPGPGIAAIIIGLSILATEVVWARVLLKRIKEETGTYTRGFTAWLRKRYKPTPADNRKNQAGT